MTKMVFKIDGGGDRSVGIQDTHATVTIEDNFTELDKTQQELMREFLREFYDIPKHMGAVLTLEEYEKQQEQERAFFEDMRADSEKEREQRDSDIFRVSDDDKERDRQLTQISYIADRTQLTQD
jgi:hypothetical protein